MTTNQKPNPKGPVLDQSAAIEAYSRLWGPMNLFQGVLRIVLWGVAAAIVIAGAHELFLLSA